MPTTVVSMLTAIISKVPSTAVAKKDLMAMARAVQKPNTSFGHFALAVKRGHDHRLYR